jgi:hypothetical protein
MARQTGRKPDATPAFMQKSMRRANPERYVEKEEHTRIQQHTILAAREFVSPCETMFHL